MGIIILGSEQQLFEPFFQFTDIRVHGSVTVATGAGF